MPRLSRYLLCWHQLLLAIKLAVQGTYLPSVVMNCKGETMIHSNPATVSEFVRNLAVC